MELLYRLREFTKIRRLFDGERDRRLVDKDRRTIPAWNNRGTALSRLGRFADALASHDQAIAIDPRQGGLRQVVQGAQ